MKTFSAIALTLVVQACQAQTCDDLLIPSNTFAMCLVDNFGSCADACSTVSPNLDFQPGVVKTCAEVEQELCPSIRCCEDCWESHQLTYQCTAVDGSVQAGLIEAGCTMDCSKFAIGSTSPPTPAPVTGSGPSGPTMAPPPSMAPIDLSDLFPTSSPVVKNCDEEAETKKFEDCVAANGCDTDVLCYQRIGEVQFDTSKINDLCSYFEPALCVVDACCSQCSASYRNALNCGVEGTEFDCNNLSCDNVITGGGSGAFASMTATVALFLGFLVAVVVN